FARLLGGVKRLEYMGQHAGGHATTRIGDDQKDVRARLGVQVLARVVLVQLDIRRLDHQLAALGHGVAGVGDEIENDLVNLARVRLDIPELGLQFGEGLNVFAEQAKHHLVVGEKGIEIENGRLDDLFAAEEEQLARESGGAFGGALDFFEALYKAA